MGGLQGGNIGLGDEDVGSGALSADASPGWKICAGESHEGLK